MGITSEPVSKPVVTKPVINTPAISKPRVKRSPINKKYITILDSLIQHIPASLYDSNDFKTNFVGSYNKAFDKCKVDIEKYVNTLVKKSG